MFMRKLICRLTIFPILLIGTPLLYFIGWCLKGHKEATSVIIELLSVVWSPSQPITYIDGPKARPRVSSIVGGLMCDECLKLIDERDQAEEVIDRIKAMMGIKREWSNMYDYNDFLSDAGEILQPQDSADIWDSAKCLCKYEPQEGQCEYCKKFIPG